MVQHLDQIGILKSQCSDVWFIFTISVNRFYYRVRASGVILCPHNYCKDVKKKTPCYTYPYDTPIHRAYDTPIAKWAAKVGLFVT